MTVYKVHINNPNRTQEDIRGRRAQWCGRWSSLWTPWSVNKDYMSKATCATCRKLCGLEPHST